MSARCDEAQAEQAPGAVERRLDHALEREVGLDLGLVEVVAHLAHLLGVDSASPRARSSPRSPRDSASACERRALALRRAPWPAPRPASSSALHRRLRAGHRVGERVVGIAGVAVQARLLEAQRAGSRARRRGCRARRHARRARSRRARPARAGRAAREKVRKGTMCERDSVITPAPAMPRSRAAWRAAARTKSGRPARSASLAQHELEARTRRRARSGRSASSARPAAP